MASKFKVGDLVTIQVRVTAVHPQGFPSGLTKEGKPAVASELESPDTLDCIVDDVTGGKTQLFVSADKVASA